jgi:hypothetical protein
MPKKITEHIASLVFTLLGIPHHLFPFVHSIQSIFHFSCQPTFQVISSYQLSRLVSAFVELPIFDMLHRYILHLKTWSFKLR